MGCYIQLLEQTKDGWRIRFGGPSDEFWTLLGDFKAEQKRSFFCTYNPSFFQGKGGWYCSEHILVKYAWHFDNYDFMRKKAETVYQESGKAEEDRREREAKQTWEEKVKQERRKRWEQQQKRWEEWEKETRQQDYTYQHKQPARPPNTGLTLTEAKSVLGLSPVAQLTEKEIKKAYRLKARETHPDAGGSHQAFVKVNLAYQLVMFTVTGVKV
jgi:hypothetical protein